MPKVHHPIYPEGTTFINDYLTFDKQGDQITYYSGMLPVFTHDKNDLNTFRMITSQFYINGNATQAEISRAFGVPAITVKRAVKKYREFGAAGFYSPRKTRGATVLTPDVLIEAQVLYDQGKETNEVSQLLQIKSNTLNKALLDKRLHKPEKKRLQSKH